MNPWRRLVARAGIATDIGLGAVFAGALALQASQIAVSWGGDYWLFGCVAGLVVCSVALLRRRHLVGAASVGLVVAVAAVLVGWVADLPHEPGPALALGLAVLVGSAIRALPVRSAVIVAAGGLLVVAAGFLVGLSGSSSAVVAVLNSITWLGSVAAGLYLRLLDTQRRAIAEQVRRDERLELARELHDVVAHHITGIVLQTQAAQIVSRKSPEKLSGSLADVEAAGSEALAAMRRVVGLLRDGDGDDAAGSTPRSERLTDLVDRFTALGPDVRLRLPDGEPGWPPEVTSTVYRIVQESLTNVSRHAAHARSVSVSVDRERDAVTVEVVDDASPIPTRYRRGGYGLVGMRERVEALGGTVLAGPRPGSGWSVRATVPLLAQDRR
ncbi:sensor histidine kinase [Actinopolymorpha pittospori]|uniref:histidine kinase n=1 Tax=Actinopolymorpha pittospori TaxID=648752 RepID=A0A927MY28_9ACTN|nr:sensor histidine kinase [Actinopolymorpha pittospori]MBE1605427.1 signal transduction histidine kinase [Actinopolymorpha pittospori]